MSFDYGVSIINFGKSIKKYLINYFFQKVPNKKVSQKILNKIFSFSKSTN